MAAFGAKCLKYAQIKTEAAGKLPTYDVTKKVELGRLVKADLTVNFASGTLYADDTLAEQMDEFASGTIAAEVDELEDENASIIYGAVINELQEKEDNTGDEIPFGGLAYYKSLVKNGKKFFRGYFYPKVKAQLGNDNAATKASSITLAAAPITFTVLEPNNGTWRYTKKFDTEADVIQWIDNKLSNAVEGVTV